MKNDMTRRSFMKTASATTAGVTIATGFNPFAYAANEKVRIGLIGTGNQGAWHIKTGLAGNADGMEIAAVCDCFAPHQKAGVMYSQCANAGIGFAPGEHPSKLPADLKAKAKAAFKPVGYYDYQEMLANEDIDAVVISTPLDRHYKMVMDSLDAGKYVFCEKTMTYTIEEGREVVQKCHDTGKFVQVGHQRRYNPKYELAMSMAYEKELFGRINFIHAQWHRNNYWRRNLGALADYKPNPEEAKFIDDIERHLNWRMYHETSHGLYSELMTHQSDIANWFLRKAPARVQAFGGLDYWRDGRDVDDNILVSFEYDMAPGDDGFATITPRSSLQKMARINKPYTVRFVYSSILANGKQGSSESICGDWGSVTLTERDGCHYFPEPAPRAEAAAKMAAAKAEQSGEEAPKEADAGYTSGASLMLSDEDAKKGVEMLANCDLHEADVYQFADFIKGCQGGPVPRTNQMCGLTTAITCNKAYESRQQGKIVEIDPALYTFDFETPDPYGYTWDEAKYGCEGMSTGGDAEEAPAEEAPAAQETEA
jgi:predicted dehydrogenase